MPNNPNAAANLTVPKKGEVRNPKGKPKGTKHLSTWIQDLSADENFTQWMTQPGTAAYEYKGAPIKAIVMSAIKLAIAGDASAREWLAKYGWGSKLEVTSEVNINYVEAIIEASGLRKDIEDIREGVVVDREDTKNISGTSEG